jgi:hypothetical protein
LVSLGRQVYRDPGAGTTGKGRVVEYEAFMRPGNLNEAWIRLPYSSELQRVSLRQSEPDQVTPLDPIPTRTRFTSGTWPTAEPDRVDRAEELPW